MNCCEYACSEVLGDTNEINCLVGLMHYNRILAADISDITSYETLEGSYIETVIFVMK